MAAPCRNVPGVAAAGLAVALACAAGGTDAAHAAEGRLAVRPGDTVRGTLRRCLDRHVAEVELLRGERFRLRVRSTHAQNDSVLLRVLDPDGFDAGVEANVRLVGGEVVAGPFRVPRSGTWAFEISTPTAHGAQYEARSEIRRTGGAALTLTARRRGGTVSVAAGSTLRVRGRRADAGLALRIPGETRLSALPPGAPELAALRGDGLTAPRSGTYELAAAGDAGTLRVVVAPPRRRAPAVVDFPTLPEDPNAFAAWGAAAGWVVDPTRKAPGEDGVTPPASPRPPATSPFSGDLVEDCPAPGQTPAPSAVGDAARFDGPASGVGLPAAGVPRLDDVLRDGVLTRAPDGPAYTLTRRSEALGDVVTRVRFLVDGVPSLAPLAIDGRVAVRWTDEGGALRLQGTWSLAWDAVHAVQVLDGVETRSADGVRVVSSAATGFALPSAPGAWPQGRLLLSFADPRLGADFTRVETYDGGAAVEVRVERPGAAPSTVVHDYR